jgi:SAM-dependent methyltransferase
MTETRITPATVTGVPENPWGYAKRLNFVENIARTSFPARSPEAISILDIGCGNGSFLALPLAKMGYTIMGVDPDEASIRNASAAAPPNASFRCCMVEELPRRLFDVVILSEVLEHVHQPAELLAKAARYLAPTGVLIVTVPNGKGEFEIDSYLYRTLKLERMIEKVRRHREASCASDNHDGHVQFYSIGRLKRIFASANLHIASTGKGPLVCGPLASYAFNWLPKGLLKINAAITNFLPMRVASGWYFVLRWNEASRSESASA